MADYDQSYSEWKAWGGDSFGVCTAGEVLQFQCQLSSVGLGAIAGKRILEIGYGNARFMTFARNGGAEVVGTEVNPQLLGLARARKFEVYAASELCSLGESSADLVVCFDVLEHLAPSAIEALLVDVFRVLKSDGAALFRVPNGDSPFGLVNQNGDPTHVTFIGSGMVRYWAAKVGFRLAYVGPEASSLRGVGLKAGAYRFVSRPVRRLVDRVVNFMFLPRTPVAFSWPNLIFVYKKL